MNVIVDYIFNNPDILLKRDFLIEIFTVADRAVLDDNNLLQPNVVYKGKLFLNRTNELCIVEDFTKSKNNEITVTKFKIMLTECDTSKPLLAPEDIITLKSNVISNHVGSEIKTTLGRFLYNYILLCIPFDTKIPYINLQWDMSELEGMLFTLATTKSISTEQIKRYATNLYFLGNISEISVPGYSRKALSTDPKIAKRRKELLLKHKDKIELGDAVIMSQIEQELIAMDKAYLKDDSSMGFYEKALGKSFNTQRKKLHVIGGMVEAFGDSGNFKLVDTPLEDGLTVKNFATAANEIRAGSYSRAMETAEGGVLAKEISRSLQNVRITGNDCESKQTIKLKITENNKHLYMNRFMLTGTTTVEVTEKNIMSLIGRVIDIRSPMTCQEETGYCYVCMGGLFKTLNTEALTMRTMSLSAFFLNLSLKKMHSSSFSTMEIVDINKFIL